VAKQVRIVVAAGIDLSACATKPWSDPAVAPKVPWPAGKSVM
jgi:hypothetical protein